MVAKCFTFGFLAKNLKQLILRVSIKILTNTKASSSHLWLIFQNGDGKNFPVSRNIGLKNNYLQRSGIFEKKIWPFFCNAAKITLEKIYRHAKKRDD